MLSRDKYAQYVLLEGGVSMVDTTRTIASSDAAPPGSGWAGAPEHPIKISPDALRAGGEVIWRCFGDLIPYGSSFGEHVAAEVYRAMAIFQAGK
jgi:hypothetical protein